MKKRIIISIVFYFVVSGIFAQNDNEITLNECYRLAKENFPLIKKSALLSEISSLKLNNIDAGKYPEINFSALATFQSENISLDFPLPNIEGIDLPLFKTKAVIEAKYTIYDGGVRDALGIMEKADLMVQEQSVEVELEKLRAQIDQVFLGIHLLQKKRKILENIQEDIQSKIKTMKAGERHGVILPVEIQKLEIEVLRLVSKQKESAGDEKTLRRMLSKLTGKEIDDNTILKLPEMITVSANTNERPELRLFDLQKEKLLAAEQMIDAKRKPKAGAFLEGGLGYPNPVNFFDDGVAPFAIVGVQFQWNIWDWKKSKREKQILTLQNSIIETQKEAFEKNLSIVDEKYLSEIEKIEDLIKSDKAIISLQEEIKKGIEAQLKNGIITSTEYLTEVNKEIQAKVNLKIHELQLTQLKINYLTNNGIDIEE